MRCGRLQDDLLKTVLASQAAYRKMIANAAVVTGSAGNNPVLRAIRASKELRESVLAGSPLRFAFCGLDAHRLAILKAAGGGDVAKMAMTNASVIAKLGGVSNMAGVLASFASTQSYLSRITSQYNSIFSNPALRELLAQWRGALDLRTEFALVMSELGWPPPEYLPPKAKQAIIAAYQALGAEPSEDDLRGFIGQVEEKILYYYTEDAIRWSFRGWDRKHLLARRLHVLQAGIDAHVRGDYLLSVPVLLAQAEGIVADGFNHKGRMSGKTFERYRADLFESEEDGPVPEAVSDAVIQFCVGVVYVAFEHGTQTASTLSRHAILHGADVAYGTPANSLKVLLFIDFLQDSFRLTVLEGSNVYHSDDCITLLRSTSRGRSFRRLDDVLAEGKRPCRRCNPPA